MFNNGRNAYDDRGNEKEKTGKRVDYSYNQYAYKQTYPSKTRSFVWNNGLPSGISLIVNWIDVSTTPVLPLYKKRSSRLVK